MRRVLAVLLTICAAAVCCFFAVPLNGRRTDAYPAAAVFAESTADMDGDGIGDRRDFLEGALKYVQGRPRYKSKYYSTGYPDDGYGTCTDVVGFGMRAAGYDLQEMVDADRQAHPGEYADEPIDRNIDFRRVRNLKVFFGRYAEQHGLDLYQIDDWQGGDIVIFRNHIGVVSDRRNPRGVPYVIHHSGFPQMFYEEDILERRHDLEMHVRLP